MNASCMPRVMWLLNHGAARRFELTMLKQMGIEEIFLPKSYPNDPAFRSASVDYSEDEHLTIPRDELDILNAADWYRKPGHEAWEIANRYFDVLFFMLHHTEIVRSIAKNYRGAALWRGYGMLGEMTYSKVLQGMRHDGETQLRTLGKRFFFAQAYAHLHLAEGELLRRRHLYLPLGLDDCTVNDQWTGNEKQVFFICPDIGFNPYYRAVYRQFSADFKGIPYLIGGAQPVRVHDPHVLGFVPRETHERNLRELRVMFYQSAEPNHVHYHPFEAVRAGMPLVFMAGGMLDSLGGRNLPGRCKTVREARRKIERILEDDAELTEEIRESQPRLLEAMKPSHCMEAWRSGFQRVLDDLEQARQQPPASRNKTMRIAVIVPVNYRGGSLSGAKLLAQAIDAGARRAGDQVEVILAHLDDADCYPPEEFAELPSSIKRRPYKWRLMDRHAASRAMAYAGLPCSMDAMSYQVPDDGINQFMDCDLWIMVSDRLEHSLLPLRPYVLMVYDYLQRYQPLLEQALNEKFIRAAHGAERVFVTTEFTRRDALQFAGLPDRRVVKLPMLAPQSPSCLPDAQAESGQPYFLWATNLAPHKNHENALKALKRYYERHDGRLACHVSGVGTDRLFQGKQAHLKPLRKIVEESPALKRQLRLLGELPEQPYHKALSASVFLWHAGWIDNGTFSVVEAAHLGIPSLSSDYPAMHEIGAQFSLPLSWMDAHDPADMASRLKHMEIEAPRLRTQLPTPEILASQSVERLASFYWEALRECL